ncbi:PIN domain-containing protein [Rhizobium giardinii]|uniref:PIN domain-containing protein n=1 Tax=Rhizobium giardinii TaxID=56731 RepID=UPI000DD7DF33
MLVAVLDADVLFPMVLRDTLLRAAAAGSFRAHWSSRILDEVMRNLVSDYGMDPSRADALRDVMEEAFPDARVEGWEEVEPTMRNHPKDRHVVAAAAVIEASVIVTSNIRDFGDLPSGIIAVTPDEFLVDLLEADPDIVLQALVAQASGYRRPTLSVAELVERLSMTTPKFARWASASRFHPWRQGSQSCSADRRPPRRPRSPLHAG